MAGQQLYGKMLTKGVHQTIWPALPEINAGLGQFIQFPSISVQIGGVFGAGGSINIEGSNDGQNWFILHDSTSGNAAITVTSPGLHYVLERPLYIRPNSTAGDGTTALTVTLIQRALGG